MGTPDQSEPTYAWVISGVQPNGSEVETLVFIGTHSEVDRACSHLLWRGIAGPFEYCIGIKP